MKLIKLNEGRYKVAAVVEDGAAAVLLFLQALPADMQGSGRGMPALFERYAAAGRLQLSTAVFHEANKQEGIWEFIKGRLRVFCFMDEDGTLLVLTHGAIKKQQKADRQEVSRAIRLRDAYITAKRNGNLEWEN
jgi:hypothetical protein